MRNCNGKFSIFWICFSLILLGITVKSPAQSNQYYTVRTIILPDGTNIDEIIINGPPTPPVGFVRTSVDLPEPNPTAGINILANVPAFKWSFGCSATSAAMISGYYDRTGYPNMYTGPTNGGVMPMNNSTIYWPDWTDSHGDLRHQCPLSATHNGLDGRTIPGHVDDYWIYYMQPGPDPWENNGQQHIYGDCTGDYMKTNQWINPTDGFNVDGSTTFYYFENGAPLYWHQIEYYNIHVYDGGYGHKLFYESRGYTVTNMYNQYIDALGLTYGFTYDQYKAEIDAGRPVMIHVTGHTMVGFGYDDATNLMYIHDTWDFDNHTMTWGGSYNGDMDHYGVTIVQLDIAIEFTNGADASLNYQQSSPSPSQNNWPFGQFSLTGSASGATLNSVTVTLGGTYTTGDLGSDPFCLYANSSNDFGTATAISSDVADPGSGNNVTFSSLSDNIPNGTRYYWVTADISPSATNDDNINGTINVSSDVSITGGTLSGASSYGKLNTGSDVSLPVELSSFTATASEGQVTLNWITQSEIENAGFIVERSQVEKGPYVELSSFKNNPDLQGRGNSTGVKEYCFIDFTIESGISYYYKLADVDMNGVKTYHGPVSITTDIFPKEFKLYQNYPNPFNPSTTIEFDLPDASQVTLKIFTILGEEVTTLVSDRLNAGNYSYEWSRPAGLASGIYLYRLEAGDPSQGSGQGFVETRKMVLLQ